jgi:YjbE family integral membrane protein
MEWLMSLDWAAVVQIIIIDLLLGGDNAVVIALACRNLPERQRRLGILWGTAGAVVLRVALISFAVVLLKIPFLKIVGALLLIWIAVKLMLPEDDSHANLEGSGSLWGAVKTIIVADFAMSLDNVVAIAGAAEDAPANQQFALIIFGLLVSIPIIVWGSAIVLKLLDKFPWIVTAGAALLGWIAGDMLITDPVIFKNPEHIPRWLDFGASAAGAILVLTLGFWLARRINQKKATD